METNEIIEETTPTEEVTEKCYKKYKGNSTSLISALMIVGETDVSFIHRREIAKKNGLPNYAGSISENIALIELLKKGKLIK